VSYSCGGPEALARLGPAALSLTLGAAAAFGQDVAAPESRPHGWTLSARAEESWESNPVFNQDDAFNETSSVLSRLGAGIGYDVTGRRGFFSLGAEGGGTLYASLSRRNYYYVSGKISAAHSFSRRTSITFSESLTSDYARRSPLLAAEGILLPLDRALTTRSTASLSHAMTRELRVVSRLRFDYVDFKTSSLLDGSQLQAGISLERTLSRRHTLSLAYAFLTSQTRQLREEFHSVQLGLAAVLSPYATATASFGATTSPALDGSGRRLVPTGSAGLAVQSSRRRLLLDLAYEHSVSQSFGLGRQRMADLASFRLSRALGRKVTCSLNSGYAFSRDIGFGAEPLRFTTQTAGAGFSWSALRSLAVDFGYAYERSTYRRPYLDNHRISAVLNYRRAPR